MKDLCRACLGAADPSNSLFSEDENQETPAYRLWKCTGVCPERGDHLPESLCKRCALYLSVSNYLRLLVEKSNNLLLQCANVKVVLDPKSGIKLETETTVEDNESEFCIDPYIEIEDIKHEPEDDISDIDISEVKIEVDETYLNDLVINDIYDNQSENLIEPDSDKIDFIQREPSENEAEPEKITEFYENLNFRGSGPHCGRYVCPKCPYSANDKSRMARHYRVHTDDRPYECSKCGKKFVIKESLVSHHRAMHSDVSYYVCEECGEGFKTRGRYNYHRKNHHAVRNTFSCSFCLMRFENKSILNDHLLLHRHVRSFKCDMCDALFRNNWGLTYHKRMIHGAHICDLCDYLTLDKMDLEKHIQEWHTKGPKVNRCKFCRQTFLDREIFKKHMFYMHKSSVR